MVSLFTGQLCMSILKVGIVLYVNLFGRAECFLSLGCVEFCRQFYKGINAKFYRQKQSTFDSTFDK